jgi:hypothetical protein
MRLEALTVCVNYADFLAWTLPLAKPHFDRLVVVTDTKDRQTRDLCEHHHVEVVATDAFYHSEKAFDKGAGISAGLQRLEGSAWIAHFDADIVLPPRTRELLECAQLDPAAIYGIDRLMCPSFAAWLAYVGRPEVQHSCDTFVQANAFPLGVRIAKMARGDDAGYVPIGFFQLWNAVATGRKTYPGHGEADRSDMRFALQWPRGKRHLIPEIVAIHLESEESEAMGANWRGRKTKPFAPSPAPSAFSASYRS